MLKYGRETENSNYHSTQYLLKKNNVHLKILYQLKIIEILLGALIVFYDELNSNEPICFNLSSKTANDEELGILGLVKYKNNYFT